MNILTLSLQTEQPWVALVCLHFDATLEGNAHKAHIHTRSAQREIIYDHPSIKVCYHQDEALLLLIFRCVGGDEDSSLRAEQR